MTNARRHPGSSTAESVPAESVLTEVADAVRLQEGPPGVRSVLRALRRLAPASTKDLSRATGLPVPIVAALGNELRRRGIVTTQRPSRLTEAGQELVARLGMDLVLDATCRACDGRELVIPDVLDEAVRRLRALMESGPAADMAIDQSHCTAETKVRRVLALLTAGALPGGSLLLVGDDDLISLAVAVVGDVLGGPIVEQVTVVDISEEILDHIRKTAAGLGTRVETVRHDLRLPLPAALHGQHDVAMTDPPYTPEGARLFLSRAVEGLRPGPAHSVFFSFGGKSPDEMLEVQREIMALGLVTNGYIRNFNEYEGSGILGGVGFFQHLLTTTSTAPSHLGEFSGPLYTGDKRTRQREYTCAACDARIRVGPGARWTSVAALRADGCPNCGKGPFRPGRLVPAEEPAPASAPQDAAPAPTPVAAPESVAAPEPAPVVAAPAPAPTPAPASPSGRVHGWRPPNDDDRAALADRAQPYVTRQADERDLPAIGRFEAEIARVSFGEDAIDDPERWAARLGRAMEKSKEGMIVAHGPGEEPVGWCWVSINQNAMTGDRYANFRSLAVSPVDNRSDVAELLLTAGLEFCLANGITEVVGRVHVGNVPMRTVYRKFGFDPTSLAMKLFLPEKDGIR
ncbi:putative methyltransferase/GNAT superfamily N-acetyltransferase/DNA-directed RNA polymerase subunit RPC12/RpoP [Streptomyces achromogenes]|uniref:Methyltransferase/GNAT superfamily N-acetyltransferase/DNA-directed RNA polymerase subunit RPC12/RpoP n=1 Tax=Streptomyces achromogenes TaxID=67255 RepID=A0ABU0Q189_STRAH|nr:putative methyltransferase/GNAT superfamily N-acetyltransferase/DNA-directed RNA polymerase subunit RPC12/RpoP [Streptomyces achromogenes]